MALSSGRGSWLMLARNCDLCSLASASCLLLSWFSRTAARFDHDRRLVGDGLNQLDLFGREWSRPGAGHCQNPNGNTLTHQRDTT
jgi:hypothetical protein